MADYVRRDDNNDMTCKDCKHFTEEHNTQYTDLERFHLCNASKTPFWVEGDCEICDNYADRDGLYSNGTWHCPRCGKEVSAWGLCNECEDSWESVSK